MPKGLRRYYGQKHPKDWPWSSWSFYVKGDPRLIWIDVVDF
jgi:hypothetical protein